MTSNGTLGVFHGDHHVGRLYDFQPLRFEYAPAWQAHPMAVSLALTAAHAARSMRFQPRYFLHQGLELAERLPAAIDSTLATLSAEAHAGTEQTLLERPQRRRLRNCQKLAQRWAARHG